MEGEDACLWNHWSRTAEAWLSRFLQSLLVNALENKLTNALRTHRWSYKRCLQSDASSKRFCRCQALRCLSLRTTWAINAWEERNGVAFTADERGQNEWIHQWRAVTFIIESCELLGLLQRQREAVRWVWSLWETFSALVMSCVVCND